MIYPFTKEQINQIRILPMTNKKELESAFYDKNAYEMHKIFFQDELAQHGQYQIRAASKIANPTNTFVLFQFDKHIIAAAYLEDYEEYPEIAEGGYIGKYLFNKESILVFDPISEGEFNEIILEDRDKLFRNVTHIINVENIHNILQLISQKMVTF